MDSERSGAARGARHAARDGTPRTGHTTPQMDHASGFPDPALVSGVLGSRDRRALLALELAVLNEELAAMETAIAAGDVPACTRCLHRILGGLCVFGSCPAIERGRQALRALRAQQHMPGHELEALLRMLQTLADRLRRLQASLSGPLAEGAQAPA